MSDIATKATQDDWGMSETAIEPDHQDQDSRKEDGHEQPTDEPRPTKKARSSRSTARGRSGALTPAQARKAIDVMRRINSAEEIEIDIAATLAGRTGDRDNLALAVLTGKATASESYTDLQEIADADDIEAAVIAAMMGRTRMKAVWDLLRASGADLPSELPDADTKLALRLAPAAKSLSVQDREALSDAAELLSL